MTRRVVLLSALVSLGLPLVAEEPFPLNFHRNTFTGKANSTSYGVQAEPWW
jgi:hypothetical protein